jgi:hypothetical protein
MNCGVNFTSGVLAGQTIDLPFRQLSGDTNIKVGGKPLPEGQYKGTV